MKAKKSIPKINKTLEKSANLFPVVGIGASAGGLDAFKKLLKAIPENSGMAYVLVQHLDPSHESLLQELLQKVTNIPVLEIADDIKVQPDHIYIIPSNKMLIANDGVLELSPRPAKSKNERNLPIDLFFTSLAEVHQSHAIGVVLSGTASDGTMGLKAIKDHGGITFAQDEASAAYEGMPHSAVQAGVVDFILPPEKIPKKLLEVTKIINGNGNGNGQDEENLPLQDEDVFKQILSLLRIRKGTDFTYYKQTTIRRRILRRMAINKNEEPAAYLKHLRDNKPEQDVLYQDLLIPVTSFFRDAKTFDNLCQNVFPLLVKDKTASKPIRIWVAGCSTGEEAYSIAICLKEFLGENHHSVQIFATDLSEPAITKARLGIYIKNELNTVSEQRLHELFTKNNGSYQLNKSIRDMCVFAQHNFLKDPPFGRMDFISCRNVLIYMEPYLQKKALTTFHYALNPKGFLLLGKSETTSGVPDLFIAVAKNDKLFSRKDVQGRFMHVASQRSEQNFSNSNSSPGNEPIRTDFQKTADDILLTKYTPASVVVNETMDIVHFRGNTANYLEQAPGKPSHNLLMMAKHGLGFELRNILHKAKTDKAPVVKDNIPLNVNGNLRNISIEAVPLPNTLEPYYLVLFHDNNLNDTDGPSTGSGAISNKRKVSAKTKKDEKDFRIQLLEQELVQAREDMRSITEDQEASNEELQSANEELLSGSEELQSLNLELETSKEELQSTNEELTVLNHELISLNEQITDARNYSESIVSTLYQPLLVLDKNLRVKTANQAFYKTFRVNEQETEGVLIYDLGNRQWNIPELRTLLEEILPQKKQITDFEVTHNFLSIGERTILVSALELTREKKEQKLILLSIEDITDKKQADNKLKISEQRFRTLVEQATYPICILKGETMILEVANEALLKIWGVEQEAVGKPFLEILPEMKDQPFTGWLLDVYKNGVARYGNEEPAYINRKDGSVATIYFNFSYQPYKEDDGTITGVMVLASDVTQQVLARKQIEASKQHLQDIFSQAPAAIALLEGESHKYILANSAYQKMINRSEAELLGKTVKEIFPEMQAAGVFEIFDTIFKTGESFYAPEFEVQLDKLKDGKPRTAYFNYNLKPLKTDGKVTSLMVVAYDITEQIEDRKKIEQSETKFRTLIEDAPVATCFFTGREMRIEIANDIMIGYWGKGKNVIGKTLADAVPELKGQPFLKILDDVFTTGKVYESKNAYAQLKLNGVLGEYYFDYTYKPIFNVAGEVYGIMDMAVDVTEQVLARKKIEESEKQFRQMAELMPQKVWTSDAEGNKNYFNKTLLDYAGLTFEDLKGSGWQKIIHPDDWEKNKKQWEESLSTGKDYETENRLLRKDGKYLWHLTQAVALKSEDGKIKTWVGAKTEIQEQKQQKEELEKSVVTRTHELEKANNELEQKHQELIIAKEKLLTEYSRSLIEASLDPLITVNTEGKITDMNQATANITGLTLTELIDTNFFEYFTEPQKAREIYKEVFAKGAVVNAPLTLHHVDRTLTDIFLNGSVYKDGEGNVLGVVLVARDVTEEKRIATELTEAIVFAEMATAIAEEEKLKAEESAKIAEDAVKAKQQFLSNMSHEIRTPMNAIIGFTKVILKTDLTAKQKEYLTAINLSGNSLIVLINDILDLAKVDAGKMTFEEIPFKMSSSIAAMIHLFEARIQEKNLELVKEYDDNIPQVLLGDPVRLHQIILNLVSNAVKFTSKGKITIGLRLLNQDEETASIEFAVADTGTGIPEDKKEKIFEKFHQASSDTSRLYGGTGLGLAIVKQLVESQGGTIHVKSKVGEGAVFSFTLSFKKTNAQAKAETEFLEIDTENKNIKVLVVEDIALNQLLMKTLLDDFGFKRDIAANGKIAIEKLQENDYDIILMDLQMPEMNGFEATEYIRNKMHSKIPIIALTADVTTVDLEKCKAVGMNDYIAKPVDERILYSKIVGLLKNPAEKINYEADAKKTEVYIKSKCTDLSYLISVTKYDRKLMMEMIELYLEQTPVLIKTIKKSLQKKDWELLHTAAHKIIPSFSIMGISPEFEAMTKTIQDYTGAKKQLQEIQGFILQVENICTQACTELEEEYKTLKNTKA